MKRMKTIVFAAFMMLAVLVCGYPSICKGTPVPKYKIVVTDGYAVNSDGEVITEAYRGTSVTFVPVVKKGSYVSDWKVNGERIGKYWNICMPDHDIKAVPVWKAQTALTLDVFGNSAFRDDYLGYYERDLSAYINDYFSESKMNWVESSHKYDADGDGTEDFRLESFSLRDEIVFYLFPTEGASARGSIKLDKPNMLPYWPVIINFGNETLKESYSINVVNGCAKIRDNVVTSAETGDYINLFFDNRNEKEYLTGWKADGIKDFSSMLIESDGYFRMPACDLTIRPVTAKKTPYTIDLRNGSATVSPDVLWSLQGSLFDEEQGRYIMDLDGDGTEDLRAFYETIIPVSEVNGKSFTLKGLNSGKYWPVTVLVGDVKEEYAIRVTGGHAEDESGNHITSAKSGSKVNIVRDKEPGKYWKSWKLNFTCADRAENYMDFSFVMPAKDVTVTAETTTSQKVYKIDLTYGDFEVPLKDTYLIRNALREYRFDENIDLDGDGKKDFYNGFRNPMDNYDEEYYNRIGYEYGLGELFEIKVDDGQIGTVQFLVDKDKTPFPILDTEKGMFKISATGVYAEKAVESEYGYDDWVKVEEACPGTRIRITCDRSKLTKGQYYGGYVTDGLQGIDLGDTPDDYLEFNMPARDVTVSVQTLPQIPLVIDMTSGRGTVPKYVRFSELFPDASGCEYTFDGEFTRYDLDRNGTADLLYCYGDDYIEFSRASAELFGQYDLEFTGQTAGKYYPIILKNTSKTDHKIEKCFVVNDDTDLTDYVDVIIGSLKERPKYRVLPSEGTDIYVHETVFTSKYELKILSVCNAAGETLFSYEGEELQNIYIDSKSSYMFLMPDEDITIYGIYTVKEQPKPTPTPTPTPSPTPEPTAVPMLTPTSAADENPSVTPVPEDKRKDDGKDDDEDNSVVLYIILASAGAFIITCAIVFAVYRKRRKAAAKTENATEQPEETLNQMEEPLTSEIPSEETAETPENAESETSDQTGEIPDTDSNRNE
ncbi:MAG: hypothetical protein J5643_06335 [Lachnospiraceae bacterium]|nr:hypothetical protein [Lachnospiraceae bacterium]